MLSRAHPSFIRCLSVWSAVTVVVVAFLAWSAPDLAHPPAPTAFEDVLVWGCEAVTGGCAVWWWVVTTLVLHDARAGRPHRHRVGVPDGVRRVVLAACGVAIAGSAVSAPAWAGEHRAGRHDGDHVLVGLPVPDRPTALSEVVATFRHVRPAPPEDPDRAVVRSGDTLWTIAERTLPPGADDARVAARTHRLYELNRDVVGADPDLIRPGQLLVLPDLEEDA